MPKTMAEHIKGLSAPAFCDLLPARDFLDNVMVRTDGSYVAAFKISGALTYFASDGSRNQLKELLESLLRTVPEESMRIQFRYEVIENATPLLDKYAELRRTKNENAWALDESREEAWRTRNSEGEYLTRIAAVYFIWNPDKHRRMMADAGPALSKSQPSNDKKKGDAPAGFMESLTASLRNMFSGLSSSKCIERTAKEHFDILAQFESILTGIQTSMNAAGLQPERMNEDELFLEVKRAMYPVDPDTMSLRGQRAFSSRYVSAREQLATIPFLGEHEGYMNINGILWSCITLKMPPDSTYPGILRELQTIGFPLVISTNITVPNQQQVLEQYKKRYKKMVAAQQDMRGNRRVDIAAQVTAKELLEIQERIIASSMKTLQLSLVIAIRTSKPAFTAAQYDQAERELAVRRQQVMHVIGRMNGARAHLETVAQRRVLVNSFPGLADEDKRELDLLTPHAADLLAVEMPWAGTPRNPLLLFDTPYRQLLPFSPFDPSLENSNAIIAATSGTGKSVLVAKMLLTCARQDVKVSILERGDSYRNVVEYMGGDMVTMSLDASHAINPFDLDEGETEPSNDQLAFLKNLTRYMLGDKWQTDGELLDNIILNCIRGAYRRAAGRIDDPIPILRDLRDELEFYHEPENPKIDELARTAAAKLDIWVEDGMYANLFDRKTTVNMNTDWLYFNIEQLKDDPRVETAMSLLIAYATTKRAHGKGNARCITVLDECWALLESPSLSETVKQLFRTARKRNACVWAISQSVEDFCGTVDKPNPIGGAILGSTAIRLIGRQKGDLNVLKKFLHMDDPTINHIKTLAMTEKGKYSEFVIQQGDNTHTIQVRPVGIEYWLTTTYPREKIYREWYMYTNSGTETKKYIELTKSFPQGLSMLDELPEEKSGEVFRFKKAAAPETVAAETVGIA